jgi:subtilisin family serine protease
MKWSRGLASSVMILVLGAGVALAQAPADTKPATGSKPVAAPSAPVAGDKTDKKAVSKACSDQATAKGLHGKERKTFRADCKKNGGKPA